MFAQAEMIEILQENEKKRLQRFIVKPCIVIATIIEETLKTYKKNLKRIDRTFCKLQKVKKKESDIWSSILLESMN